MPERWKIHPMPASYFTADDLEKIADAVDKGKLKEDSVRALHMAALAYVTCLVIEQKPGPEDNWPPDAQLYGRADRRAALKRIGLAAIKLKEALEDGLPKLRMERSALTEIDTALLHQLANDADAIWRDIPKRGSDPERARRYFVSRLASIFESETGQKATRRHNTYAEADEETEYGPFRDFVFATLEILNKPALKGIDHVIKKVINSMATNDAKSDH